MTAHTTTPATLRAFKDLSSASFFSKILLLVILFTLNHRQAFKLVSKNKNKWGEMKNARFF